MTSPQQERRFRQKLERKARLERELAELNASLLPLETELSRSIGFCVPILRGDKLLAAIERDAEFAEIRARRAA